MSVIFVNAITLQLIIHMLVFTKQIVLNLTNIINRNISLFVYLSSFVHQIVMIFFGMVSSIVLLIFMEGIPANDDRWGGSLMSLLRRIR